jgi:hypothetical protein
VPKATRKGWVGTIQIPKFIFLCVYVYLQVLLYCFVVSFAGKSGAVFHTPCKNHCGDIEKQLAQERRIRKQGRDLHSLYLEAAQEVPILRRKVRKHLHKD